MAVSVQIADLEVAREFWSQISIQIPDDRYRDLDQRLKNKSRRLQEIVFGARGGTVSFDEMQLILRSSFASRRKAKEILATCDFDQLSLALTALADDGATVVERTQPLRDQLQGFEAARSELPFELLHNLYPSAYWPFSKWIWNPDADTGALRLLVNDEFDLFGEDDFDTYKRVCLASEYLFHTLAAAGLGVDLDSPFSFDIFLAGVYSTYMSTVLEMKMTREFNQIVPGAVELAARLLGVYKLEVGS